MKKFLFILFVSITLESNITDTFKIKEETFKDANDYQGAVIENGNNVNQDRKNSADNEPGLALIKTLTNDDEYARHKTIEDSIKRQHRNKRHDFERSKRKQRLNGYRKNSVLDGDMLVHAFSIPECSFGKERADDGSCVSIEIAANSSEIVDIDVRINFTTWLRN